jgi:hypothetical protein
LFNPDDYYPTQEDYEEAAHNGISRGCVNDRIRILCWEKQKAITKPVRGRKYPPEIYAIAKAHGITGNQLRNRLNRGWGELRAATTPLEEMNSKIERTRLMGNRNRIYPLEVIELAMKNGISVNTFLKRMSKGWDCSHAATIPASKYNGAKRVKDLYGEDYFTILRGWLFAPGRIRNGEKKKNP